VTSAGVKKGRMVTDKISGLRDWMVQWFDDDDDDDDEGGMMVVVVVLVVVLVVVMVGGLGMGRLGS